MAIEIVDFPMKNGDFPWQNVSSPDGICYYITLLSVMIKFSYTFLSIIIHVYHETWGFLLMILVIQWGYNQAINKMIFGQ